MRLDNFRGWGLLAVKGKVKAGATPGLAFGTTPPINVSPLGIFSVCQANCWMYVYIMDISIQSWSGQIYGGQAKARFVVVF